MKIELTRDHELVNRILNEPEILAAVCPDGVTALDAAALEGENRVFVKVTDKEEVLGLWVVQRHLPGVYEIHTCLLPTCRGVKAVIAGRRGVEWLFLQTDAERVFSLCPASNQASLMYAGAVGFRVACKRLELWVKGGQPEGATVVEWTVQEWAYASAGRFEALGHKLHEEVFAPRWQHEGDDPLHEGMVGLAMEMAAFQPVKAERVYNTWAVAAGYAPVRFLGLQRDGGQLVDLREALAVYYPKTKTMQILKEF